MLRAARDAGVKRVVLTSSFAAISRGHGTLDREFTEDDWTDIDGRGITAYVKSTRQARVPKFLLLVPPGRTGLRIFDSGGARARSTSPTGCGSAISASTIGTRPVSTAWICTACTGRCRMSSPIWTPSTPRRRAARARQRYSCFDHASADDDGQAYGFAAAFGAGQSCEQQAIDQLLELQRNSLDYMRRDGLLSEDEQFYAQRNAMVVRNAEVYYRTMFSGRTNSWNLRDEHMAETLDALLEHLDHEVAPEHTSAPWSRWTSLASGSRGRRQRPIRLGSKPKLRMLIWANLRGDLGIRWFRWVVVLATRR